MNAIENLALSLFGLTCFCSIIYLYFAIRLNHDFKKTHSRAIVESWWTHYPTIAGLFVLAVSVLGLIVVNYFLPHY